MASKEAYDVRERLLQLIQGRIIAKNDDTFWSPILTAKLTANETFDTALPAELDSIAVHNPANYHTLATKAAEEIVILAPSENTSSLLYLVRLLTKILPPLYQQPRYAEDTETSLFFEDCPQNLHDLLGYKLLSSLVVLLYRPGFTVDQELSLYEPGICRTYKYATPNLVYESNRYELMKLLLTLCSVSFYDEPKDLVLTGSRFLTLLVTAVPRTKLTTLTASLFNVLLRASRQNPEENMLLYEDSLFTEVRHLHVTAAANLLVSMVVYPIPSRQNYQFMAQDDTKRPVNICRAFLAKISDDRDIAFMATHLMNLLKITTKDSTSWSPPPQSAWANQALVMLWEMIQCNQAFLKYISGVACELSMTVLHNVFSLSGQGSDKSLIQLSAHFLLYISSRRGFLLPLMEPIDTKLYESLPLSYKFAMVPPTTRDFLVLQICNKLLMTGLGLHTSRSLLTCLVETLYNFTTSIGQGGEWPTGDPAKRLTNYNSNGGLSFGASLLLGQVVSRFSDVKFFNEESFHADLLAVVLRAVCTAALKYPVPSRMLIFSIIKNEKLYDRVWNTVYNIEQQTTEQPQTPGDQSDQASEADLLNEPYTLDLVESLPNSNTQNTGFDEDAITEALRPRPLRGMSKRAKEKQPMNRPLHRTWGGSEPLHILLTVLVPHLKLELADLWEKQGDDKKLNLNGFTVIKRLEKVNYDSILLSNSISTDYLPTGALSLLIFSWNKVSLAWYISLIQGDCYNSETNVRLHLGRTGKLSKSIVASLTTFGRFASGISGFARQSLPASETHVLTHVAAALTTTNQWADTHITSFQIEQSRAAGLFGSLAAKVGLGASPQTIPASPGPHDMPPTLVRRISDLRLSNSNRNSVSPAPSGWSTPQEEQEPQFPRLTPRNSVSSLHSLNTLNRTRSNTPRNSISL